MASSQLPDRLPRYQVVSVVGILIAAGGFLLAKMFSAGGTPPTWANGVMLVGLLVFIGSVLYKLLADSFRRKRE